MAGQVTQLLDQLAAGNTDADPRLFAEVYATLRSMAQARMAQERPGHTLSPTALVNEAYLRLLGSDSQWNHRRHFFSAAARAMRRILIDHARRRSAQRRGGEAMIRVDWSDDIAAVTGDPDRLLQLDQGLGELEAHAPELAEIVSLHFFAGFTFAEIAGLLQVSERTVLRRWRAA